MATIYRAVSSWKDRVHKPFSTRRAPRNVPYVVDNIWEWARPRGEYVNRRFAAYGSPSPEAAEASVKDGTAYRVEFLGEHRVCQLNGISDAKHSEEIKEIKGAVFDLLGNHHEKGYREWRSDTLSVKHVAGQLYTPCLSHEDVEAVLDEIGATDEERQKLRDTVSYWDKLTIVEDDEPLPSQVGEIVFSYEGGYRLHPIEG